ncbi:MAG: hypothetical protein ACLTQL_05820 [Eisenbergiella sp.]
MTFKDVVKNDIRNVFLNLEEFGEMHLLNGQKIMAIIDENELTEREKRIRRNEGELHKKQLLLYVAAEDFGPLPFPNRILEVDGINYTITDAENEDGIYSISLEAVKS